jgi:hypothetical protein
MTRRPFSLLLIAPLAFSLAACSGDEEEEQTPEQAAIADATALTSPVEDNLDNPTGLVSTDTAGAIFAALDSQDAAQVPLGFVPGAGPSASPQQSGYGSECMEINGFSGTIDFGCLGGAGMSGEMTYTAAVDGDDYYIYFVYDHLCVDTVCLDGDGAQKIIYLDPSGSSYESVMAFEMTVTDGSSTFEIDYGFKMVVNGNDISFQYVVWVDGESYVVTWSYDSNGYEATITGSNGSFSCSASIDESSGQISGSCTGDGEFNF